MSLKLFNFHEVFREMRHFEDKCIRTLNVQILFLSPSFGFHITSIFKVIAREYFSVMCICAVRPTYLHKTELIPHSLIAHIISDVEAVITAKEGCTIYQCRSMLSRIQCRLLWWKCQGYIEGISAPAYRWKATKQIYYVCNSTPQSERNRSVHVTSTRCLRQPQYAELLVILHANRWNSSLGSHIQETLLGVEFSLRCMTVSHILFI